MKVICAPDSFKGSIDAVSAAAAMAAGIAAALDDVRVEQCPLGDGGEGTLRALATSLDGDLRPCSAEGLHGSPVKAEIGYFAAANFAFVESAEAIGMQTLAEAERDIMTASSFGVGELMLSACDEAPARLLVALGGTATNDGGCGMAQALGVRFYDESDRLLDERLSGGSLQRIHRIDIASRSTVFDRIEVIALCDVNNPLSGPDGAAAVFAPQKGASPENVEQLDAGLRHLAGVIRSDIGIDVSNMPGAGAAGGLGAGLAAFAGANLVSGIETVLDAVDFRSRLAGASLCITGEGRLDGQSLGGKTCMGVARAAAESGVPVVALAGSAGPGAEHCLDVGLTEYVVISEGMELAESMQNVASLLADNAARVAKKYRSKDDTIER